MKKALSLFTSVLILSTFNNTQAVICPDKENAPLCPENGLTLLDETYPTQSFVISNSAQLPTAAGKKLTHDFISKIIKNFNYSDVPQVIFPTDNLSSYLELVENIKKDLEQKNIPEDKVKQILGQITFVPSYSYTWQQDWFESFIDVKTGTPVIRQIESYTRLPLSTDKTFTQNAGSCGVTAGPKIHSDYPEDIMTARENKKSFGSGEMGGNIEGAPGGFCLVGDNQGTAFTNQFCGDQKNVIQLQTSWLEVGHVDEIFKIIPTQFNDGRPKECEFSLMAASPKKAFELMKDTKRGQTSFFNLKFDSKDLTSEQMLARTLRNYPVNITTCNLVKKYLKDGNKKSRTLPAGARSVLIKIILGLANEAKADAIALSISGYQFMTTPESEKERLSCAESMIEAVGSMTNFDMQEVLKQDADFLTLNQAIDESIEADRILIKEKILNRLPQCLKFYNEIEAPGLFYGKGAFVNKDNKLELLKPGVVNSLLPNPTNSVLMNKTIVLPDSGNNLFNDYVSEEIAKKKMNTDLISSWDYAHLGNGNIHCASHSIPHCKPRPTNK